MSISPAPNTASPASAAAPISGWLKLAETPGLGAARVAALIELVGDATQCAELAASGALADLPGLDRAAAAYLRCPPGPRVERALRWAEQPGQALVGLDDVRYPELLRQLPDPPPALFVKGDPLDFARRLGARLAQPQVALVGSRGATSAGQRAAERLAADLVRVGLAVTSGLARGIDGAAHRGALRAHGTTLAVFAQGLDSVYPRQHERLAAEIVAADGLLLSEMGPGTPVTRGGFPRRNRIIAGLALAVVVIEAAPRSGSLITARLAAEYGREVLAVPGIAGALNKAGCHQLLRDGAALVERVEDVLAALPAWAAPSSRQAERAQSQRTSQAPRAAAARAPSKSVSRAPAERPAAAPSKNAIYAALDGAELGFDALARCTGLDASALSAELTRLELAGWIERRDDGFYVQQAAD